MAWVFFGAVSGSVVQSQNFVTNIGMLGTIFGQSRTEFQTVIGLCVLFLCVIAKK